MESQQIGMSEFNSEVDRLAPLGVLAQRRGDSVHQDIQTVLDEMRSAHDASATAFAELRRSLIRWIVCIGILVVVLLKLL